MNQEKIGKFIFQKRKEKKLTQGDLASLLGVTEKSVSNWENGRNMPDLALFKPLCEALDISINELLSGEKLAQANYQEKLEENIVNTINYTRKNSIKQIIPIFIMTIGLLVSLSSTIIFITENSWSAISSLLGVIAFILGVILSTSNFSLKFRIIIPIILSFVVLASLLAIDYINVELDRGAPMYRINTYTANGMTIYDTLFYDVYICPRTFIEDKKRVFYPNYQKKKTRFITANSKYSSTSIQNFCNKKASERLIAIQKNIKKTKYIVISKSSNEIKDDKTYTTDYLFQKYEIVKKIDNYLEIKDIISNVSKAEYAPVINLNEYEYLFQLYDEDDYELAEITYNKIYDGNEVLNISLSQKQKDNLNKYFE